MDTLSCPTLPTNLFAASESDDRAETGASPTENESLAVSSSGPEEPATSDRSGDLQGVWCHKTATVEERASIGPGTRIGPWSHIMSGATIGSDCRIGRNVVVAATAVIGDGVVIGDNVVVEDGVTLELGVYCGSGVAFATIPRPRAAFLTGIATQPGPEHGIVIPALDFERKSTAAKPIVVRRGASLGAGATILGGVTVREFALVEPGSAVSDDVRSYARMSGAPARQAGWICHCGAAFGKDDSQMVTCCSRCKQRYRAGGPGLEPTSDERERRERNERHWAFLRRAEQYMGTLAAK